MWSDLEIPCLINVTIFFCVLTISGFFSICIIIDCRPLMFFNLWIFSVFSVQLLMVGGHLRCQSDSLFLSGRFSARISCNEDLKLHIKSLAAWDEGQPLSDKVVESAMCFFERWFIECIDPSIQGLKLTLTKGQMRVKSKWNGATNIYMNSNALLYEHECKWCTGQLKGQLCIVMLSRLCLFWSSVFSISHMSFVFPLLFCFHVNHH